MSKGPSPKLDALRVMREAQATGSVVPKLTTNQVRATLAIEQENSMAKATVRKKAKKAAKTKPRKKTLPMLATPKLSKGQVLLQSYLTGTRGRTREEIGSKFGWVDHTVRSELSRLAKRIEGLSKTRNEKGDAVYCVA